MTRTSNSIRRCAAWLLAVAALALFCAAPVHADQDASAPPSDPNAFPDRVMVYWQRSRNIVVPGVSHVLVLDDSICRANTALDRVEFFGIARGESVVFVWIGTERKTLLVDVVPPPSLMPAPRLANPWESLGHGYFGTSVQTVMSTGAPSSFILFHHFAWDQQVGPSSRLSMRGQFQDSTTPGTPGFNMTAGTVEYTTPHWDLALLDSAVQVNGGMEHQVVHYSPFNSFALRGVNMTWFRGKNQYEVFAGSSMPYLFTSLGGTRDLAGFNFSRALAPDFYWHGTTAFTSVPIQGPIGILGRHRGYMQTLGLTKKVRKRWGVQGSAGLSNSGAMTEGAVSFDGGHHAAFVALTRASANFPLTQMQLLTSGQSALTASDIYNITSRLSTSLYYQHIITRQSYFSAISGNSDYINTALNYNITRRHRFTFDYIITRNSGNFRFGGQDTGRRADFQLYSQITDRIANSGGVSFGSLSDPFAMNAQSNFAIRDSASIRIKRALLSLGFSHSKVNPSLVGRLSQELSLLTPDLQKLFLANPVEFVTSPLLPPDIRALLDNLTPTETQFTAASQFTIKNRLTVGPNFTLVRSDAGTHTTTSDLFGYTANYQATRNLQLQSSLSNVMIWDSSTSGMRRNTVLMVGVNKTIDGGPGFFLIGKHRNYTVEGHVFRDNNVNGAYNAGEPGLGGVRVELNTGESAVTDNDGHFEFKDLKPGAYRVVIPVTQFKDPVRLTTSNSSMVQLYPQRKAEVNFGIVNFARVMGNVFNDYKMDGMKQMDATGMQSIRLTLTDGKTTLRVDSDGAGDFEFDDVAPGDYQLMVDRSTVPPNFVGPSKTFPVHVAPVSTVIQDIPVRAVRSMAGRVFLKMHSNPGEAAGPGKPSGLKIAGAKKQENKEEPREELQPLAGVTLAIDRATATTDEQGNFLLRNLPAGNLVLQIVPRVPVPEGVKLPSGAIHLGPEPVQMDSVTITISNPELLQYLLPQPTPTQRNKP